MNGAGKHAVTVLVDTECRIGCRAVLHTGEVAAVDLRHIVHKEEGETVGDVLHDLIHIEGDLCGFVELIEEGGHGDFGDFFPDAHDQFALTGKTGIVGDRGNNGGFFRGDRGDFHIDQHTVARFVGLAEFHFADALDVKVIFPFRVQPFPHGDFRQLCHGFHLKHARHDRVRGEVPHKVRFGDRHCLEGNIVVFVQLLHTVEKGETVLAGQDLADLGEGDDSFRHVKSFRFAES